MGQTAGQGRYSAAVYGAPGVNCRKFAAAKNFRAVCSVTLVADCDGCKPVAASYRSLETHSAAFCGSLLQIGASHPISTGTRYETHRFSGGFGLLPVGGDNVRARRAGGDQPAASDSAAAADSASAVAADNVVKDQGARLPRQNHGPGGPGRGDASVCQHR